jgi:hypothetical protein
VKDVTDNVEAIKVPSSISECLASKLETIRTTRQFLHAPTKKLVRKAKKNYANKYDYNRAYLRPLNLQLDSYNQKPQRS